MENIPFIDTIWEGLAWVAGIVGAVLAFIFQPVRIAAAVGNAIMQLIMKLAKLKAVEEAVNTRKLPKDGTIKTAEQFDNVSANRAHRIRFYLDMRRSKKAARHGPYALQLLVEDWFNEDFQSWQRMMKSELINYDRYEEQARTALYAYERGLKSTIEPLDHRIEEIEDRLWRAGREFREIAAALPSVRRWDALRQSIRHARKIRQILARLRKRLRTVQKLKDQAIAEVDAEHGRELEIALRRLSVHEERYLLPKAHLFGADWLSQELTVESGRALGRLLDDTPKCRWVRRQLALEDLPWTLEAAHLFVADRLRGRVGFSPNTEIEDRFEAFLRLHLLELPPGRSSVDPNWVKCLAPPGVFGISQDSFGVSIPPMGWLHPPAAPTLNTEAGEPGRQTPATSPGGRALPVARTSS